MAWISLSALYLDLPILSLGSYHYKYSFTYYIYSFAPVRLSSKAIFETVKIWGRFLVNYFMWHINWILMAYSSMVIAKENTIQEAFDVFDVFRDCHEFWKLMHLIHFECISRHFLGRKGYSFLSLLQYFSIFHWMEFHIPCV